jgi:hypothetical protein
MDIAAHGLWAGAAMAALAPQRGISPRVIGATVALAILPDLGHMLPVTAWALSTLSFTDWWQYAIALPGGEPLMPDWVLLWSHHLHCVFHSALVAASVTLLVAVRWPIFWWPLLGWWSHILIDVSTHSADFFPSPVFYPLTYWGFDSVAWNQPTFIWINYLSLTAVWVWLGWRRYSHS